MENILANGKSARDVIDVEVSSHGSIFTFTLRTGPAREWVDRNVGSEGWQWLGADTLCVDWRYASPLVRGMMDAGLEVSSA